MCNVSQRHHSKREVGNPSTNDTELRHLPQDQRLDSGDIYAHGYRTGKLCHLSQRYDCTRKDSDTYSDHAELRHMSQDYSLVACDF